MGFLFRAIAPALAVLALFAAVPASAPAQTAEQEFSRLNADRAHRLGVQQYRAQNYDLALRHFERAVALAPDVEAYRHSLAVTKQRIAIAKANQRTLQENINRSRKSLAGEDSAPNPLGVEDDGNADAGSPAGSPEASRAPSGAPKRGGAATRPGLPGGNAFDDGPILPGLGVRDATRDLGLGGSQGSLGAPSDLPIAGSNMFDLPVGQLPPEPTRPEASPGLDLGAQTSEAPVPTSGEGSMFPFLDSPADAAPVRPRGRASGAAPPTDGPNLDTPETLP